jgi:hypothetical protein
MNQLHFINKILKGQTFSFSSSSSPLFLFSYLTSTYQSASLLLCLSDTLIPLKNQN